MTEGTTLAAVVHGSCAPVLFCGAKRVCPPGNASDCCALQEGAPAAPTGPTSFAQLEGLLGQQAKPAADAVPAQRPSSKLAAATLLGRLQAQSKSQAPTRDGAAALAKLHSDRVPRLPANFAKVLQRS